jgi:hypothetical protein
LLAHGRWFSPGSPASSTTKTGCHDIAEILLKMVLNTRNQQTEKYISVNRNRNTFIQCLSFGIFSQILYNSHGTIGRINCEETWSRINTIYSIY